MSAVDGVERRIAALQLLLGVGFVTGGCSRTATAEDCTKESLSGGWFVDEGYVAVPPGAECPEFRTDLEITAFTCCPARDWKEATCDFVRREDGQVSNGYGHWWATSDTGFTQAGPVREPVDLCVYTGVFEETNICCGRPLLHAGHPMVAEVRTDRAWCTTRFSRDEADVTAAERCRIAEHWVRSARLEHASMASFARFTLELLRFGAPPELVAAAQLAGLDEVRHAELCFSVASAFLDDDVGPDTVDLTSAAALSPSLFDFAEAVAREGCIGETLAALDAAARRAETTDPRVHSVLGAIEEDESRHATLAWRTLRWLLSGVSGAAIRERLSPPFSASPVAGGPHVEVSSAERTQGFLGTIDQERVFADGWRRVIAPAWEALQVHA